ncbi:hypothetical protein HanIR_Chr01g0008211 [Helianthus annuus]|nr:hypothetical protein HanIR_Chr01g0008211 [Helianthus annuus]
MKGCFFRRLKCVGVWVLGCVPELKIPSHPSPPLHVFPNWKDYYQAKKTHFLSSPLPLLSGSLEHSIRVR